MLVLHTLLTSILLSGPQSQPVAASRLVPEPTGRNLQAWSEHVLPTPAELRWESIPWLSSFSGGLFEAGERKKPLILWAMNGHPLGCT
jgi:hypothetical protein